MVFLIEMFGYFIYEAIHFIGEFHFLQVLYLFFYFRDKTGQVHCYLWPPHAWRPNLPEKAW